MTRRFKGIIALVLTVIIGTTIFSICAGAEGSGGIKKELADKVCISDVKLTSVSRGDVDGSKISPNTIITSENIYDVLKYLGISSENFIETHTENESPNITVAELEKVILDSQKDTNYSVLSRAVNQNKAANNIVTYGIGYGTGTKMLYNTTDYGPYQLTSECAGQYSGGSWTGIGSANVTINDSYVVAGSKYIIKNKDINTSLQDNRKTIKMNSSVVVGGYITLLDIGLIQTSQVTVTSTNYWYIRYYI